MEDWVKTYLDRIKIESKPNISLQFLILLQNQHILNIPFENLDVINKKHIELTSNLIVDKILNFNRGGFCFELNGAFHNLLTHLGFQVRMIEASVYSSERGEFGEMRNHMTLIVTLDKEYLVDVGFGDSFRKPLILKNGSNEDISGKYRIRALSSYTSILQKFDGNLWLDQYKFIDNQLKLSDYQNNCNWIQTSPDSHFTQSKFVTIGTESGRITLSDNNKTITHYNNKKIIKYDSNKDFGYYLSKEFDMTI